jgi:hypothetical protein
MTVKLQPTCIHDTKVVISVVGNGRTPLETLAKYLAKTDGLDIRAGKNMCGPGLPDGFFSNQKSQFGYILEGPRLENVDICYGHLEYFTDIWNIL